MAPDIIPNTLFFLIILIINDSVDSNNPINKFIVKLIIPHVFICIYIIILFLLINYFTDSIHILNLNYQVY